MGTLTIRGCEDELMDALRKESRNRPESINKHVIEALEEKYGQGKKSRRFNDLDSLAGTWTEEVAQAFETAVADSRRVDRIVLPLPVLAELRIVFRGGNRKERNLDELERFLSSPRVEVPPMTEQTAILYAELFRSRSMTSGSPLSRLSTAPSF